MPKPWGMSRERCLLHDSSDTAWRTEDLVVSAERGARGGWRRDVLLNLRVLIADRTVVPPVVVVVATVGVKRATRAVVFETLDLIAQLGDLCFSGSFIESMLFSFNSPCRTVDFMADVKVRVLDAKGQPEVQFGFWTELRRFAGGAVAIQESFPGELPVVGDALHHLLLRFLFFSFKQSDRYNDAVAQFYSAAVIAGDRCVTVGNG